MATYTNSYAYTGQLTGPRAQRKTSLPEATLYASAPRLGLYDSTFPPYDLVNPQSAAYATEQPAMSQRHEQFHYSHPCVNPQESPAHLSGFMYAPQYVEDDVPTISVDNGLSDMFGPSSVGAYSPSAPGTPSDDAPSASPVDFGLWSQDLQINTSFGSVPSDSRSSPAMSDAALYVHNGPYASPHEAFLQMPGASHNRQRSSSEPNLGLIPGFHNSAPTSPLIAQELPATFLPHDQMFLSPTDSTPTSGTQQFMPPPTPAQDGTRLRRAVSLNGGANVPRASADDYLSPTHPLSPAYGVVRSRSLGSSRSPSPYSRGTSPSGSELSDAPSARSLPCSEPAMSGAIAKAIVTTGPVAEASAIRRTHAAKFMCEICGVALTTKTNLEGHRKSHLGLKEHKCSLCDKSFTRDWDRKRHEKTHAKAELHCNVCGKTSSRKDAFDKHRCRVREDEYYPVSH